MIVFILGGYYKMKRVYIKPTIDFESFALSENIAACNQNEGGGVITGPAFDPDFGMYVFTSAIPECELIMDDGCYTVSIADSSIYTSK